MNADVGPATNSKTRIWTDVDFDRPGKNFGHLRVPHSSNTSGYGWLPVPVFVFNNGDGPGVLLMAGNHGDEYEGQVLLMTFARAVSEHDVRGRIIVVPGVNGPAVAAGSRVSPIDGGNLNRLFPGDANGTPTQMIAHYIVDCLLPQVRYCFDFHSGGYSSEYVPAAHLVAPDEPKLHAEAVGFLRAFGMPNSILIKGLMGGDQRLLGACRRLGVGHMSTELGGAGSFSLTAYRAAEKGLPRLLRHVGALKPCEEAEQLPTTTFYERHPAREFVYATATGLFEPYVDLGQDVEAGDPAGAIHVTETPWREPEPVRFTRNGVVLKKRAPARTNIGDCLFALGDPCEP